MPPPLIYVLIVALPWFASAVELVSNKPVVSGNATLLNVSPYTRLTSEDMNTLPLPERTVASALRLCQERAPGQFCAWLRVNPYTELVSGGACFDESKYSCNKIGYSGSKSSRRTYRYLSCHGCESCLSERSACDSPDSNCTVLCYCSCGRRFNASLGEYSVSDNWRFAYPCTGVCNNEKNCPGNEDEPSEMCAGLYSAEEEFSFNGLLAFFKRPEGIAGILFLIIVLLLSVFASLNAKQRWVPWLLKREPPPRSDANAALLSPQQQQQPVST